jgi:hypothetical protein
MAYQLITGEVEPTTPSLVLRVHEFMPICLKIDGCRGKSRRAPLIVIAMEFLLEKSRMAWSLNALGTISHGFIHTSSAWILLDIGKLRIGGGDRDTAAICVGTIGGTYTEPGDISTIGSRSIWLGDREGKTCAESIWGTSVCLPKRHKTGSLIRLLE